MSNARPIDAAPTSPKSDRVKWVRALDRRALRLERGLFRVEGPQAVREAIRFPHHGALDLLYLTDEAAERYPELAQHPLANRVSQTVIAAMSEASTPQGVLGVARLPHHALADLDFGKQVPTLVAVAVDVRDPGNLGTMIRTADAAGADLFIAANSCVDPFSPKVVRSAVGSHWHLPLVSEVHAADALAWCRSQGLQVLAADGATGTNMEAVNLGLPTAWVLGNEAWGLTEDVVDLTDQPVAVPIYGKAESLNVAVASAILLFASARAQHGSSGAGH